MTLELKKGMSHVLAKHGAERVSKLPKILMRGKIRAGKSAEEREIIADGCRAVLALVKSEAVVQVLFLIKGDDGQEGASRQGEILSDIDPPVAVVVFAPLILHFQAFLSSEKLFFKIVRIETLKPNALQLSGSPGVITGFEASHKPSRLRQAS